MSVFVPLLKDLILCENGVSIFVLRIRDFSVWVCLSSNILLKGFCGRSTKDLSCGVPGVEM